MHNICFITYYILFLLGLTSTEKTMLKKEYVDWFPSEIKGKNLFECSCNYSHMAVI